MSDISLANLEFISREDLAKQLRASQQAAPAAEGSSAPSLPENLAIIDVRDGDHVGGHIRGSTWVPSSTLDYKSAELVRELKDKEVVVFHCALSQQRGPGAALRYLREKKRLEAEGGEKAGEEGKGEEGEGGKEGKKVEQKVVVLKGGFTEWQEKYGPDERLTEKWQKDIWE